MHDKLVCYGAEPERKEGEEKKKTQLVRARAVKQREGVLVIRQRHVQLGG